MFRDSSALGGNFALHNEESFPGRFIRIVAAIAKKLLPERAIREIREYRAYKKDERLLYLKTRISNGLRFTNPKSPRVPNSAKSILFVCFGNIMRSPMCEALLKQELANSDARQITVTSAGLNAVPDRPAHAWAITAAREFGISLDDHRARLLTAEMVHRADVIFVMDYQNQVQLLSRWTDAKEKVLLLSAYASPDYQPVEIFDPYYSGLEGTRRCYAILDTCIQNLARGLLNEKPSLVHDAK